jgi:hypothetical protein
VPHIFLNALNCDIEDINRESVAVIVIFINSNRE